MSTLHDQQNSKELHLQIRNAGMLSVLTLPGHLKDRHAEVLKIFLRRSLDQDGRLIVDCGNVSAIEPECLRILCSAYRLSRAMHKDFVVAGHQPDLFLKAVRDAKYAHCIGCGHESDEQCLWEAR